MEYIQTRRGFSRKYKEIPNIPNAKSSFSAVLPNQIGLLNLSCSQLGRGDDGKKAHSRKQLPLPAKQSLIQPPWGIKNSCLSAFAPQQTHANQD